MPHQFELPAELQTQLDAHPFRGVRRAYKFATSANAQSMRERGLFRIGRLEEFRGLESQQLRDLKEGLNAVRGGSEINYHDLPDQSVVRQTIGCAPGINVTIKLEEG